jgi:peptide deformylase
MVYPIFLYGSPVLRKVAKEIDKNYPKLREFIDNMFETMQKSEGIGLAAPQVGESIRLFVINGTALAEDDEKMKDFKKVFINAKITERSGDDVDYNEGCLSLPGIREEITRKSHIRITYYDENFEFHDEEYDGLRARVIQHEYDHTDGILLIDHIPSLKRKLLRRKLTDISKGIVEVGYKIKAPKAG